MGRSTDSKNACDYFGALRKAPPNGQARHGGFRRFLALFTSPNSRQPAEGPSGRSASSFLHPWRSTRGPPEVLRLDNGGPSSQSFVGVQQERQWEAEATDVVMAARMAPPSQQSDEESCQDLEGFPEEASNVDEGDGGLEYNKHDMGDGRRTAPARYEEMRRLHHQQQQQQQGPGRDDSRPSPRPQLQPRRSVGGVLARDSDSLPEQECHQSGEDGDDAELYGSYKRSVTLRQLQRLAAEARQREEQQQQQEQQQPQEWRQQQQQPQQHTTQRLEYQPSLPRTHTQAHARQALLPTPAPGQHPPVRLEYTPPRRQSDPHQPRQSYVGGGGSSRELVRLPPCTHHHTFRPDGAPHLVFREPPLPPPAMAAATASPAASGPLQWASSAPLGAATPPAADWRTRSIKASERLDSASTTPVPGVTPGDMMVEDLNGPGGVTPDRASTQRRLMTAQSFGHAGASYGCEDDGDAVAAAVPAATPAARPSYSRSGSGSQIRSTTITFQAPASTATVMATPAPAPQVSGVVDPSPPPLVSARSLQWDRSSRLAGVPGASASSTAAGAANVAGDNPSPSQRVSTPGVEAAASSRRGLLLREACSGAASMRSTVQRLRISSNGAPGGGGGGGSGPNSGDSMRRSVHTGAVVSLDEPGLVERNDNGRACDSPGSSLPFARSSNASSTWVPPANFSIRVRYDLENRAAAEAASGPTSGGSAGSGSGSGSSNMPRWRAILQAASEALAGESRGSPLASASGSPMVAAAEGHQSFGAPVSGGAATAAAASSPRAPPAPRTLPRSDTCRAARPMTPAARTGRVLQRANTQPARIHSSVSLDGEDAASDYKSPAAGPAATTPPPAARRAPVPPAMPAPPPHRVSIAAGQSSPTVAPYADGGGSGGFRGSGSGAAAGLVAALGGPGPLGPGHSPRVALAGRRMEILAAGSPAAACGPTALGAPGEAYSTNTSVSYVRRGLPPFNPDSNPYPNPSPHQPRHSSPAGLASPGSLPNSTIDGAAAGSETTPADPAAVAARPFPIAACRVSLMGATAAAAAATTGAAAGPDDPVLDEVRSCLYDGRLSGGKSAPLDCVPAPVEPTAAPRTSITGASLHSRSRRFGEGRVLVSGVAATGSEGGRRHTGTGLWPSPPPLPP